MVDKVPTIRADRATLAFVNIGFTLVFNHEYGFHHFKLLSVHIYDCREV